MAVRGLKQLGPQLATGHLRDSELLYLAENLLSFVVESTSAAIFVKDLNGRYLFVNRRCEALWGVARDEILGKTDADLLPTQTAEALRSNDQATLQSERALEFEELVDFPSGKREFLSLKAPMLARDGTPYGLYGVATDITERARDQRLLRESEQRFRLLADSAPVLIWMSDAAGVSTYFNQTWLDFTGRDLATQLVEGWTASVHPDDRSELSTWEHALRHRCPFKTTLRMRYRDGTYRWMLNTAVPRGSRDGEFVGFIGSMMDVTEARELEAALEKRTRELAERDRRKDEFLAVLGHELRNPLSALRGATDLLKLRAESSEPANSAEIEVLDRQIGLLSRLVDDLLDVARVTRGRVRLSLNRVELSHILQLARDSANQSIVHRSQHLSLDLPSEPIEIDADPARLAQVISNLLLNASKYSPQGSTIRLIARCTNELEIRVIDEGIGIAEDMLDRVFEPFAQERHDFHRVGDGLGLGLTLVRALVALHRGTVQARSPGPNQGAEFVVRIPLAHSRSFSGDRAHAEATPPQPCSRSILIVDDNVDSANLLAEVLRLRGHDVATANDGHAALAQAERRVPDVALLDLSMPVLDGFGLARALRQRFGSRVRLVAVTGHGQERDRREARAAGFDIFLVKPVTAADLARAISA